MEDYIILINKKEKQTIMNYNFDENLEKNLNEKINWFGFNTDTRTWSVLADKYTVREYIKSKELDFLLNDIYQKCDNIKIST